LIGGSQAVERVQQRLEHLGHGSLEAFVQSEVATLSALPSQISQQELEKTAETIVEGKTTFLFGYGHSEALVTLMDIRLSRSGFVTRVMREPPRHLAADIENIGAGDVVILFVFNVISPRISAILKQAKDVGAKSIVISDPIGPLLRPLPDILLSASRGEVGEARSITVPMAICNALILVISEIDEGRSINHLALVSKRQKNLRGLS
jgi:DNA-binding MurR/RpiR family transcriptional regulator